MNKTFLLTPLALLCALPTFAQSQSNVTLYGRVDLGIARNIGDDTWVMQQGSGSRLGLRGSEDLGGGLKAIFNIEHRFSADTGTASSTFWGGRSVLGFEGGFGTVTLGREYTPARNVANAVDPWGGDTVASNEGNLLGGFSPTRKNNSLTYTSPNFSGLRGQAQVELDEVAGNDTKATYGLSLSYAAGPLSVAYGFDKSAKEDSTWNLLSGGYDFGMAKLLAAFGTGKDGDGVKHRSYLVGATAPLGAGQLRVSYSRLESRNPDEDLSSKFGVGYHHPLSKRTTVYIDVANDSEADSDKTGMDVGIKHNF